LKATKKKKEIKSNILINSITSKMVKHKSHTDVDRYMVEYRMRTPYATPTQVHQITSNGNRRSKSNNQSQKTTPRHAAHELSHSRHNPAEPFYHSEGRIDKSTRVKKGSQQENGNKQTPPSHGQELKHETVSTTKKSACCTIL
jgi:hypothetical protein